MLKIQIKLKSTNAKVLQIYLSFIKKILNKLNISVKIFFLPTTCNRLTLLKSPHVNKSAREQFEIKVCSCILQFATKHTNTWSYILINKPKIVSSRIRLKKLTIR